MADDRPLPVYHNQWLDATFWAIKRAGKPLSQKEVWEKISKFVKTSGKTPLNTLNANINQAIKRGHVDFCRTGPGTWGLKSLGHDKQFGTVEFSVPSPCKWKVRSETEIRPRKKRNGVESEIDDEEDEEQELGEDNDEKYYPKPTTKRKEPSPKPPTHHNLQPKNKPLPQTSPPPVTVANGKKANRNQSIPAVSTTQAPHEAAAVPVTSTAPPAVVVVGAPQTARAAKHKAPIGMENDEYRDVLRSAKSPLVGVSLLDIVNMDTFSNILDSADQFRLIGLLSTADIVVPSDLEGSKKTEFFSKVDENALVEMFSSLQFQRQANDLADLLQAGLMDMSTAAATKIKNEQKFKANDEKRRRVFDMMWAQHLDLIRQAEPKRFKRRRASSNNMPKPVLKQESVKKEETMLDSAPPVPAGFASYELPSFGHHNEHTFFGDMHDASHAFRDVILA